MSHLDEVAVLAQVVDIPPVPWVADVPPVPSSCGRHTCLLLVWALSLPKPGLLVKGAGVVQ